MRRAFAVVLLAFFAFLTVAPLFFLFCGSLMGKGELDVYLGPFLFHTQGCAHWRLFPLYPTLRNYVRLALDSPEFFRMFWNTMAITAGTLAGQLFFGLPSAWGLARYPVFGKRILYMLCILLMMLPFQVTMLSEYLVLDRLGLLDSLRGIIAPGAFSTFSVFLMYRFFCGIPEEMLDSARIDGAGELQIFLQVGLPLGASGIFSALVLQFLECFSMIEQPLVFLQTKSRWPLALYLPEIREEEMGFALCCSFVALLPSLLVFGMGQQYLEQGIMAGAVKE
ncbi:MAG: carbohydrate ABC transporter permease [Blautia sp.]|nr:carbohydrate ABC transporter permease [Blautia sp.]